MPEIASKWAHLECIKKQIPSLQNLFGMGIIGPTNMNLSASSCHRILTGEIGGAKIEEKFCLDTWTKEVINPREVVRMFELDFSEREGDQVHLPRKTEGLSRLSRMASPTEMVSMRFHFP